MHRPRADVSREALGRTRCDFPVEGEVHAAALAEMLGHELQRGGLARASEGLDLQVTGAKRRLDYGLLLTRWNKAPLHAIPDRMCGRSWRCRVADFRMAHSRSR